MSLMGITLEDVKSETDSGDIIVEFTRALTEKGLRAD